MKKLILGLVLSVGMSGMAFASNEVNLETNKNLEKISSCSINTYVTVRDSTGKLIASYIEITSGSGSQCNGAINGVVYATNMIRLKGRVSEIQTIEE